MLIIPAIDLMNGKCVRLIKGEKANVISYAKTPMEVAEEYVSFGAGLLHVVDLDGAFTGEMKNLDIIKQLAKKFTIQVGGGVRSEKTITNLLDLGVSRVVASTLLLKDRSEAEKLKEKYFGKLLGSFDFKNGKLSYAGWTKTSELLFEEVVEGLPEIIATDTSRDGTFLGPNLELLETLVSKCRKRTKIISAGGVSGSEDLAKLEKAGIAGAIVGRAFLDGKLKFENGLFIGAKNQKRGGKDVV
jgi:phosphoribosylformimino-5-aminoimidazole carboxamide ribotide isomerase